MSTLGPRYRASLVGSPRAHLLAGYRTSVSQLPPPSFPQFTAAVFDLDGTIYRGEEAIPGAIETLHRLTAAGVRCGFVSNNSTRLGSDFAARLRRLGFPAADDDVLGSAAATGAYAAARHGAGASAYVVGAPALRESAWAAGLVPTDGQADCVIVGLDQEFSYATLTQAVRQILGGADFIATNPDRLYPMPDGLYPGAGTVVASVAAGVSHLCEPTYVGKPYLPMLEQALAHLGASPAETLMVGDQISTDIAGGAAAGMITVLVTTGAPNGPSDVVPDVTLDSLTGIPTP